MRVDQRVSYPATMVQPALAASPAGRAATCDTAAPGGARARRPADQCGRRAARQAAREIAGTIASSNNRVFLNSDSLLLNLVRARRCPAPAARGRLPGCRGRPQPYITPCSLPYHTLLTLFQPGRHARRAAPSCTTLMPAACLPALCCRGAPLPSAVRPPALRCGGAPSWRAGGSGKGGRGVLQHALAPAGAPAQVGAPARTASSAAAAHGSLSVAPGVLRRATRAPRT